MKIWARYSCYSVSWWWTENDEWIFEVISLTEKQAKLKLVVEPLNWVSWLEWRMNFPVFKTYNYKKSNTKKEWLKEPEKYEKELREAFKKNEEARKILVLKVRDWKITDFLKEEFVRYVWRQWTPFIFTLI